MVMWPIWLHWTLCLGVEWWCAGSLSPTTPLWERQLFAVQVMNICLLSWKAARTSGKNINKGSLSAERNVPLVSASGKGPAGPFSSPRWSGGSGPVSKTKRSSFCQPQRSCHWQLSCGQWALSPLRWNGKWANPWDCKWHREPAFTLHCRYSSLADVGKESLWAAVTSLLNVLVLSFEQSCTALSPTSKTFLPLEAWS